MLTWRGLGPRNLDRVTCSELVHWIDAVLEEACDAASMRIGRKKPKRTAYWWSDSAAVIRRECFKARRRWQAAKKKNACQLVISRLSTEYKDNRKELRKEINRLKSVAWDELISTIENDPWGLPYKLVLNKLKVASLGLTERLEEDTLRTLLDSLFPVSARRETLKNWSNFEWNEDWSVGVDEVDSVIRRVPASGNKAPGPDGFRKSTLKKVNDEFLEWIRLTYDLCLRSGLFPAAWKRANLVLIPKANSSGVDGSLKTRPICLLNEIAKGLERIIAERLYAWMSENPESDLSENQYGFRRSRFTCDAVGRLREITMRAVNNGDYAVVIGIDIRNAFNSLPWHIIRRSLRDMGFPEYIRRIVDSYLSDRFVQFIGKGGALRQKAMMAGVPQGSVLGPVLWNIAFDSVLKLAAADECCNILCYADDTLIVVTGGNLAHSKIRAELFAARVKNHIHKLGLTVADSKTVAMLFAPKKKSLPTPISLMISNREVLCAPNMRYLGIQVDNKWTFKDHFDLIQVRVEKIVRALNRLMPNLRGPDEKKRRLYGNVVLSVILYGAPVWGDSLGSSRKLGSLVSLQRSLAQRIISSYRTVSGDVACLLARLPPVKFLAAMRRKIYMRIREHQAEGTLSRQVVNAIKSEESLAMLDNWRTYLERPGDLYENASGPSVGGLDG